MEVKHSEKIGLVGLEAERVDGEKPVEYPGVLVLWYARVVNGKQEYVAETGSAPCLQKQLAGVTHITDIGE